MRSFLALVTMMFLLMGAVASPVGAQDDVATPDGEQNDVQLDNAFSDEIIGTLGYPEIEIEVSPEGVKAPSTLTAGYYLVTLSAPDPYVAYLDFMQPPAGLDEKTATELALAAAREDLAQEGWVYAGGNNTFDVGVPVSFIIQLVPGEYQIAASYYLPEEGSEEIMRLLPLTVTASDATPAATPGATPAATPDVATPVGTPAAGAPPAGVTLEMTDDLRFIVTPDPVPAGPQIWEIANTGEDVASHVVMVRIPEEVTADRIVSDFTALMSGTPPAGEPVFAQFTFVGYAALQSGGQTTWVEFDLEPATYAVISYIFDPATGRPHVIDGMVTVFTVE
ncbi:MAG: hypothetical protein M3Q71_19355 [Chloroflexota bacterium]|nr:hypothetical protein [Chloroflexota bacterium]